MTAGQPAQRGLGGLYGVSEITSGAHPGAGIDERSSGQAAELLAQLRGAGQEQGAQLVDRLSAGLDRAAAGYAQRPDRLPSRLFGVPAARPDSAASAAA